MRLTALHAPRPCTKPHYEIGSRIVSSNAVHMAIDAVPRRLGAWATDLRLGGGLLLIGGATILMGIITAIGGIE